MWESGRTEPRAKDIATLCGWYQVSADWLLGVDPAVRTRQHPSGNRPPLWAVPVVPLSALLRWILDAPVGVLQTGVAYPPGTAAGVVVSSDAVSSSCPTGCFAVVSKGHPVEHGDIVAASVSRAGDPVLRRLVREGGGDLLVADDHRFPAFRLDAGARVLGRVVEVTMQHK